MRRRFPFVRRPGGFTLVEVTLALGVAAVGMLAVFGLLPTGINSNQIAIEQTAATNVLSAVNADLRSALPTGTPTSAQFSVPIPANPVPASAAGNPYRAYVTANGTYRAYSGGLTADAHFLLTVTFLATGTDGVVSGASNRGPTLARLKVSWPAAAGATNNLGSVEQLVVLDRN